MDPNGLSKRVVITRSCKGREERDWRVDSKIKAGVLTQHYSSQQPVTCFMKNTIRCVAAPDTNNSKQTRKERR